MRNLKKFLALVMAMVMAFSLMLSASAANTAKDFDDASSITEAFVEATDVLTGMKVFQGDEGGFRPADTITRAEVAALIYRLATGDVDDVRSGAYANYGNFTDVAESDWFAGYVGYCANAGYIKGKTPTTFDPYASVTGYEALAMILRAIGYDKNGEFTGSTWETNVSALATQLGILTNIKTTHYGNTLYLASRRDVVAELLFQADAKVNMVNYTPAFGYQPYGDQGGVTGAAKNPTLGEKIFGLALSEEGVLLGNQQTGETGSVMGYASDSKEFDAKPVTRFVDGSPLTGTWPTGVPYSAYTWKGPYDVSTANTIAAPTDTDQDQTFDNATDTAANAVLGTNVKFELETGIDLIGHNLKLWYDDGSGVVSNNKKHVYAYFDKATLTDVVTIAADNGGDLPTNGTAVNADANNVATGGKNLYNLADAAGFKVGTTTKANFNNSFGRFGSDFSSNGAVGNGVAVSVTNHTDDGTDSNKNDLSPVHMYKLISNSNDKKLDAVIALNIESSQITESNNVNRVPTLGIPVMDNGTVDVGTTNNSNNDKRQLETMFITAGTGGGLASGGIGAASPTTVADKNVKGVGTPAVLTGVIAQNALVGNSTKALGDYEMGIHITGTTPRTVSSAEAAAINNETANLLETAYFLLNKVTAPVEGTVVAYNVNKGTVTLDDGTVLERSKYYHTVAGWSDKQAKANPAPNTAIPQGWIQGATNWEEGYANVGYKFYLDHEGKYLGAERSYGASFLYGTYQDYSQETSTSAFNYYLTGVTLDGEIETVQLKKYWQPTGSYGQATATTLTDITGTNNLGVPFRDTYGAAGTVNGIGTGVYRGFAITGETADAISNDPNRNRNEYLNNMNRLGIHNGAYQGDATGTNETAFNADIAITNRSTTLGAQVTVANGDKYFTEATKFILVSGYGTDSVKAEVYNGISELKGAAAQVTLNMDGKVDNTTAGAPATGNVRLPHIVENTVMNAMTYYTESPYTYAQSGDTSMKIDTIILPKAAVSWSGGSGLYYVGDPNYTSINSWGTDSWKYNLYLDGELQQVWLTNDPNDATGSRATTRLTKDSFLNLKDTGKKANDGEPIYTAGMYDLNGSWTAGKYFDNTTPVANGAGTTPVYNTTTFLPNLGYVMENTYSAVTRDAQTATFSGDGTNNILLRVAEAKVVNLNAQENCIKTPASGYIWPGITDLQTLNQAGSIDPVTGRALKVAAVIDPSNPLIVTCIYVCYEQ